MLTSIRPRIVARGALFLLAAALMLTSASTRGDEPPASTVWRADPSTCEPGRDSQSARRRSAGRASLARSPIANANTPKSTTTPASSSNASALTAVCIRST